MLRNVIEPLVAGKSRLKHVSILQGTKAYGVHLHPIAIPARESDPRDNHANFFFDQQDYVATRGLNTVSPTLCCVLSWSRVRPPAHLTFFRPLACTRPFAARRVSRSASPGAHRSSGKRPMPIWLATSWCWAAQAPEAANQIFNVTNGDVFEWRSVWPAMAETLGVKVGSDAPTSIARYIRDNADVWKKIVAKYGLASGDLRSLVGQGDQHADFAFAYGAPAGPVAFVSTIKLRKAGFNAAIDTREAFRALSSR